MKLEQVVKAAIDGFLAQTDCRTKADGTIHERDAQRLEHVVKAAIDGFLAQTDCRTKARYVVDRKHVVQLLGTLELKVSR